MTGRTGVVYGITSSDSDEIRYVGKTIRSPEVRLRQHQRDAKKLNRTHLHAWINSLTHPPRVVVLATGDAETLSDLEIEWIAKFDNLVNHTKGGDGGATRLGMTNSTTQRAAASRASRGRVGSGHRDGCRCGWCRGGGRPGGWKMTDEQKEKLRIAQLGRRHTEEARRKMSLSQQNRKPITEETRQKMSQARSIWWQKRKEQLT